MDILLTINGREYEAEIYDSETGRAFMALLPLSFEMEDENGTGKCRYLSKKLPVNSEEIEQINAGDIMLLGASCLTIFYEPSKAACSYTRLGRIKNPDSISRIAGRRDADVSFRHSDLENQA